MIGAMQDRFSDIQISTGARDSQESSTFVAHSWRQACPARRPASRQYSDGQGRYRCDADPL